MKRNFGLDLIRAVAILFVLIDHGWYFVRNSSSHTNILAVFGYVGVEMFFVLSGFLIGQILLKNFTQKISFRSIEQFYIRRWFRTLPLYYAFLIVFIGASAIVYKQWNFHLYHFVFLQNFFPKEIEFFGIAWSLSIEEWFYLLLPIFFILIKKHFSLKPQTILNAVFLTIVWVLIGRILFVITDSPTFDMTRKSIFLRFDSLFVGVALSVIKIHFGKIYKTLQKLPIFSVALLIMAVMSLYYVFLLVNHILDSSFFLKTLGLTLVSLATAGIIPYLENNKVLNEDWSNNKILFQSVTTTSLISYSMYLVHLEVFTIYIVRFSAYVEPFTLFFIALFSTYAISYALYHVFEKPVMDLRDRIRI